MARDADAGGRFDGEVGADFHTFHGVDAHQGVGDVGVEAVVHRFAPGFLEGQRHNALFTLFRAQHTTIPGWRWKPGECWLRQYESRCAFGNGSS
jgi:hypothetical protein